MTEAAGAEAQAPGAISEEEVSALLENGAAADVKPFDFQALRINRTRLPMLEIVAKSFAERMHGSLSHLLGREVTVEFAALDSVKAGELQPQLPVPASLAVIRLKPLPGTGFVSVEPALLLALLDGFFGGSGRVTRDTAAAIAPAALRFLGLMLRAFAADLTAAFQPVTPLELELVRQETNPRLMQLGAAGDRLLAMRFTVVFSASTGRIDWLLPESMLAPIRETLAGDGSAAVPRKEEVWAPALGQGLLETELETRAVLAQARISLRELVSLAPGDIIPIEEPQQVVLLAGDVPLYGGRFGVSQGRHALKIISGGVS